MGVKTHLNLAEYAAYKMVQPQAIRYAITTGKIKSAKKEGGSWIIDVEAADKEWAANYNPAMDRHGVTDKVVSGGGGVGDGGENESFSDAKTKKARYDAKLKELEYKERIGELVSKEEVYKDLYEKGKELRQELQGLPDRLVDDILAARTRHDAHRIFLEGINKALERLTEIESREL